ARRAKQQIEPVEIEPAVEDGLTSEEMLLNQGSIGRRSAASRCLCGHFLVSVTGVENKSCKYGYRLQPPVLECVLPRRIVQWGVVLTSVQLYGRTASCGRL